MRGVWGVLSKIGGTALVFGGTVSAVDNFRCHDSFYTVVVDSKLDSRTDDYVEPIRLTKQALKKTANPKCIRDLSEMWIKGSKQGKLSQIYPGYYGESLVEGPKADVFRTCTELSTRLSEIADAEVKGGNSNGLEDAVRAIEVVNIIRYGSYETLFTSSAYLRKPTKILKDNLDKISPSITARLQRAENPQERAYKTRLLEEVVRRQRNQYALRYGKEMTKEDDTTYVSYIGKKGGQVAAEHFFGFDREIGYRSKKK